MRLLLSLRLRLRRRSTRGRRALDADSCLSYASPWLKRWTPRLPRGARRYASQLFWSALGISTRRGDRVHEIVERRDAVGLGPEAGRAGSRDAPVLEIDVKLAVQQHVDALSGELDSKRVPGVGRHRRVDVLDGVPLAAGGVVERHVVLERVRARDVVVVAVLPAPDDAARLVLPAAERLELDLHEAVGEGEVLLHAPGECSLTALLQDVRRARGSGVGRHGPARGSLPR